MTTVYIYSDDDVGYQASSLTRSGATATLTTETPHNFENSLSVIISGADQLEYNGTFTITVVDAFSFTYTIVGTPVTPATGAIEAHSGRYLLGGPQEVAPLEVLPYTTETAPLSPGVNQVTVYELATDTWFLTDDFRGDTYYLAPDYLPIIHSVVGPFPTGAVTTIPLAENKLIKIDLAYFYFQQNIHKNITVAGTTLFGNDAESLIYFLLDNDDAALSTKPTKMYLPNRTITTLSRAQLTAIHRAWSLRVNVAYNNMETLVNAINAAANQAALDAIDVTAGWPA